MQLLVPCCVTAMLFALGMAAMAGEINQAAINAVKAGDVDVARASWWGFDPDDSTDALQSAIDSGARTLIVDNLGKPWIVRPIKLASNQTIIFDDGVEILAKRGEFKGKNDSLFAAFDKENISLIGYNATMRMRRSDYDGPEYEKAEWRMALDIRGCSYVKVYGLTLAESGGDGIFLGRTIKSSTNRNVHIKDVVCDQNYRQGISVISAENLLIENSIMSNTAGTAPQAGIDLEPDYADERLVNVIIRNCVTKGNRGSGYKFYLRPLTASSEPVSARVENCKSIGDNYAGAQVSVKKTLENAVKGFIEFVDCVFEGSSDSGIEVSDNPVDACKIRFSNCVIENAASKRPKRFPISVLGPSGYLEFSHCIIRDTTEREPIGRISVPDKELDGVPLGVITGNLIIEREGKQEQITITSDMLDMRE